MGWSSRLFPFRHLNENCKEELGVINKQRPFEPLKVKQPCLFILWYYSTNCRLNRERSWFFRKPLVAGPQVSLTAGWARGANGGMSFEEGGPTQWRVQNIGTRRQVGLGCHWLWENTNRMNGGDGSAWPPIQPFRIRDENGSDTDGYHLYYICFYISALIRIRIRIVSTISG